MISPMPATEPGVDIKDGDVIPPQIVFAPELDDAPADATYPTRLPLHREVAPKPGVLVVDDEDLVRRMLMMTLRREGFNVWVAADGWEAIKLYPRIRAAACSVNRYSRCMRAASLR